MSIETIAVIGLGSISNRHRGNIKKLFPSAQVIALSSSGRVPNKKIDDADEIVLRLEDIIERKPLFVIVASPATVHKDHAEELIKNRIPVLIEKPLASNSFEASQLKRLTKQSSSPVAVGYCLRYLSSALKMKELLSKDYLGPIYNCFINVGQFLPEWRPDKDYKDSVSAKKSLGGGALLELSHELDYAQWLFGPLTLESAILRNSNELEVDVEEIADFVCSSNKGVICNIHMDFLQKSPHRSCSIIGETGRLDWNLITNTIVHTTPEGDDIIFSEPEWDRNNMYLNMVQDFMCLINGKTNSCIDVTQAELTINLIDDIKLTAKRGQVNEKL